jgi:integrase
MAAKITDKLVAKLALPTSGYKITNDDEVSGFGVRVTAAGARSFVLRYRTRSGRERTYTIGPCGEWTTTQARERAKDIKARIRTDGFDPLGEIEAEREAPTVEDLAKRFLTEHASKKRPATRNAYRRVFDAYILPALKHRKVAEVQYADVEGLHRKITETNGPYIANRIVATCSKAFNLAIRWRWIDANPAKGIERNSEEKRKRYLDGPEIVRLTEALNKHSDQKAANVIRMLLLTGARKTEVLSCRWDQLDLEEGIWTKQSSETKQKRDHVTPLSAAVRQLLVAIKDGQAKKPSPFVFPGRAGQHLQDIKEDWWAVCHAAGIVEAQQTANGKTRVRHSARIHDLRHTHASILVSAGMSLPLVGALLGHSQPNTTARYAHLHLDAQRKCEPG